jgi:hypothetical protein
MVDLAEMVEQVASEEPELEELGKEEPEVWEPEVLELEVQAVVQELQGNRRLNCTSSCDRYCIGHLSHRNLHR